MGDIINRLIRIAASGVWAWLAAAMLKWLNIAFTPDQSVMVEAAIIIILTAVINAVIGMIGLRWPKVERVLLVAPPPSYKGRK